MIIHRYPFLKVLEQVILRKVQEQFTANKNSARLQIFSLIPSSHIRSLEIMFHECRTNFIIQFNWWTVKVTEENQQI